MTDSLSEIIDELSNNEKKVLLTLQKIGKNASPELIVKNGGFKQLVEVMNAASWLQAKNLVNINEELNKYYSIGKKQLATKDLPERRVLKLLDKNDIVFRTSSYICDRTVLINCSKSSLDLNRDLIEKLKIPGKIFLITFEINETNGKQ